MAPHESSPGFGGSDRGSRKPARRRTSPTPRKPRRAPSKPAASRARTATAPRRATAKRTVARPAESAPGLPRLALDGAIEAAKLPVKVGANVTFRALDAVTKSLRR